MKILQVCHKSPFPPSEGGPMAMKAIRDGLLDAGHHVHTFTLSTPKFTVSDAMASQISYFSHSFIDTSVYIWPAFRDLCLNRSHHVSRFYNEKTAASLLQILQKSSFDAVLIESIFMMPYFKMIRKFFSGPIILRAHNVEHLIWERIAANETNILKKKYLQILSKQLRRFEINCFLQADAIAAISSNDADSVLRLAPDADVVTIPFAIGLRNESIPQKSFCARFGHIGSMDWAPNLEGIDWFLNFVWPLVIKKCPQASFFLAGRNMPSRFVSNQSLNLFVEGEVQSSSQFMLSLDALIVPLFSGSGVRIKIAEALSLGVPVITTPVGSEGLLVKNGRDIIISDNALQMTTDICRVIDNPDLLQNISENGLNTIRKHHSSEIITQNLTALIERKMKS
ncbi:MAG: glycosyltransferase family 4 protein [Bacteroidales bacterium]|jgi:glycosyltransferase involved in cell wall biosynthesis|nr:glycosyltransferase family 4 protein [Bacteroidales bacterium]HPB01754.1 glycosyltransferase family 4 protein [Bacteroidales bacterium]